MILLPEGNAYCLESDRRALVDFQGDLDDPKDWLASWKGENCCQWSGITCNNKTGAVIGIDLGNPNPSYFKWRLGGKIRPSLTKLKSLSHFSGISIPKFVESVKNLRYLNLSNAGFSGAIPPNLGNLSSLQYLDLSSDYSVSSDSLDWLSGVQSLKYLQMNGTNLSNVGSDWIVPLNKLPSLSELHLPFCGLSSFLANCSIPYKNLFNLQTECFPLPQTPGGSDM